MYLYETTIKNSIIPLYDVDNTYIYTIQDLIKNYFVFCYIFIVFLPQPDFGPSYLTLTPLLLRNE